MNYQQYIIDNFYRTDRLFKEFRFYGTWAFVEGDDDVGIYIDSEKSLLHGLENGYITILDEPIPTPNPEYFYKLKWHLPKERSYASFFDLRDKLKNGTINIQLNGYWNNEEEIREWILEDFDRLFERIEKNKQEVEGKIKSNKKMRLLYEGENLRDIYKAFSESTTEEKEDVLFLIVRLVEYKQNNLFNGAYSSVNKRWDETYINLPTRKFKEKSSRDGIGIYWGEDVNTICLGEEMTNMYELYCQPNVSPKITINKSITFANFFVSKMEDDLWGYGDHFLGYSDGNRELMRRYAELNVAYGTGGNSLIYVWEGENDFVICNFENSGVEDLEYDYKYYCDKGEGNSEKVLKLRKIEWVKNMLSTHKLLNVNSVDMSMRRWMAMETDALTQEDYDRLDGDFVTAQYSGGLIVEDYYHSTRIESDIPEGVFAILKKIKNSI